MARLVSTSAYTALFAATSLGACTSSNTGAGGAGAAGGATVANTSGNAGSPSSTHATSASTGAQQGAGGSTYVCSPPAAPGSLYEKTAVSVALDTISMCQYRGDVLLIVDTAGN